MDVIAEEIKLPNQILKAAWDSIKIDQTVKDRLVAQSLLALQLRSKFDFEQMPIHGLIVLSGAPGTGKTTLARGLAGKLAETLNCGANFLQIDAHALASSSLGKSQKEVTKLFNQTIPERAAQGATIILLDEVETLAADRQKMSMEANPIDVHRATDAALAGIDLVARGCKNTIFIATTNYPDAVDHAFLSRADLIEDIGMPNEYARSEIIREVLSLFMKEWSAVERLANNLQDFVNASEGLDGRALRKAIIAAAGTSIATAQNPGEMTSNDILRAINHSLQKT